MSERFKETVKCINPKVNDDIIFCRNICDVVIMLVGVSGEVDEAGDMVSE